MGEAALFEGEIEAAKKWTERDVLDRLAARYARTYRNGTYEALRYVGARHVRINPGFSERGDRIADFIALDCWRGTGPTPHPLLGFEVKVSRSDYLSEIRDLSKSEPFRRVCSEWYLVVSDKAIVRDDLPAGWGLLIATNAGLRCVRKSAINPTPDPMPRGLIAGLLRAVASR